MGAGLSAGGLRGAVLYASLGGVGRNLLENGVDLAEVVAELAEQSGAYTKPVLLGAGVLAAGAAVFYTLTHKPQPAGGPESPAGTTSSASAPGSSDEANQGVRVQSEQQLLRK
ncbi:hypothetical protein HYH03_009451 [Edaphochlamys debaryana]|uniref:Uncharacterized protein n=1 Tax=Edaphochlamys debaryana TaxID=47281 RepID=A0A836BYF9_9CHLO|nr:hypothetical protein HYH03_009451 [Edaphochlamys debaryana]|eukprot:KAG2492204.1 hypothetical protein HYH03_009451 [Edaphochlamys debaryana]